MREHLDIHAVNHGHLHPQGRRRRSFMVLSFTFQKRRAHPKETLPSKWRTTLLSYLGCFDCPKRQGSTVASRRM